MLTEKNLIKKTFYIQSAGKSAIEKIYGKKIFSISEILDEYCAKTERIQYNGITIGIRSSDYLRFIFSENVVKNDFRCAICGTRASHFRIKKDSQSNRFYLHLYGFVKRDNCTKYIIFNRDHIIPKALGGTNTLENYQLTCSECNCVRGTHNCSSDTDKQQILNHIQFKQDVQRYKNQRYIKMIIRCLMKKAKKKNKEIEGVVLRELRNYLTLHEDEIVNYIAENCKFFV